MLDFSVTKSMVQYTFLRFNTTLEETRINQSNYELASGYTIILNRFQKNHFPYNNGCTLSYPLCGTLSDLSFFSDPESDSICETPVEFYAKR